MARAPAIAAKRPVAAFESVPVSEVTGGCSQEKHVRRTSRQWMILGAVILFKILAMSIGTGAISALGSFNSMSTGKPDSKTHAATQAPPFVIQVPEKKKNETTTPAPKSAPPAHEEEEDQEERLKEKNYAWAGGLTKEKEVTELPKPTDGYKNPNTEGWDTNMSTADPNLFKKASKKNGKYQRIMLDPFRYPTALCNDGSQGLFYYAPPTTENDDLKKPDHYIVMLEGGGWCSDINNCRNRMRDKRMTSSTDDHSSLGTAKSNHPLNMGGCMSTTDKRNPFLHAHKVLVRYCSSDGFAGNRDASDPISGGLHFRGSVIVAAVIKELVLTFGLVSGDSLFLGGFSAGGRGAMFNMDYAPQYLPPDVRVVGLLDSPFWLDIEPYSLQHSCAGVLEMANGTGVLGDKCRAAFPDPNEQWKCLLGQYRMHYLEHPYVLIAAQHDGFQMSENMPGMEKQWKQKGDAAQVRAKKEAYREAFATHTRLQLRTLPLQAGSVFSTTCDNHVTSDKAGLWDIYIQNGNASKAWNLGEMFAMAREHQFGVSVVAECPQGRECRGCWNKDAQRIR